MSQRGLREEEARAAPVSSVAQLRSPPAVEVELVRDVGRTPAGFLQVREVELRNRYADGQHSAPYRYFMVERSRLDAVAVVLYRQGPDGCEVVLRSQLRPPMHFRKEYEVPIPALGTGAVQWEIPAGLIEPGEHGTDGLFARASAEALEEVGVTLPASRFARLGHPTSLSPGLLAEKLHFVCAEILPDDPCGVPAGDGHPVEERSLSVLVPLEAALRAVEDGLVHDIKTEVGLRRLHQLVGAGR